MNPIVKDLTGRQMTVSSLTAELLDYNMPREMVRQLVATEECAYCKERFVGITSIGTWMCRQHSLPPNLYADGKQHKRGEYECCGEKFTGEKQPDKWLGCTYADHTQKRDRWAASAVTQFDINDYETIRAFIPKAAIVLNDGEKVLVARTANHPALTTLHRK